MALIKCSECGKEISDKALTCPNCGCPVSELTKKEDTVLTKKGKSIKLWLMITGVIIILAFIMIVSFSQNELLPNPENLTNVNLDTNSIAEQNIDYSVVREQMSNFNCDGRYNIYDGWVYSLNFPEDGGSGLLSKMRTDGSDYTVLTEKGTPNFIHVDGEYIYCIIAGNEQTKVHRCRLGGNDLAQLIADDAWYLQVNGDSLYYTKHDVSTGKTLGFYRANKDGTNEEVILDKEIYYSYVIGDTLYYQDDNDGETIHKYDLVSKTDTQVTDGYSYGFVVDGLYGYYIKNDKSTAEKDHVGSIMKIDLNTKEETLLYNGVSTSGIVVSDSAIYFINANDADRIYSIEKNGANVKLISQDTNCSNLAVFDNKLIYLDHDDEKEYVDAIFLCSLDGSNKINISKTE